MKITVLVENEICKPNIHNLGSVHGLSVYIETGDKKILFDVGPDDLFAKNAKKLNIDIGDVDMLILSHGHKDHGGGLNTFCKLNKKATVYMHKDVVNKLYANILGPLKISIGLDQSVINRSIDRIEFIEDKKQIFDNISILEDIQGTYPKPKTNDHLYKKSGNKLVNDDFTHELILVIEECDGYVVFTGCSHSGIINMLEKSDEVVGEYKIKAVFGGFHLHNPINNKSSKAEYIDDLSINLNKRETVFYTGHCTGKDNFDLIKGRLGDKLKHMNTGLQFQI